MLFKRAFGTPEMDLLQTLARENRYAEVREDVMTYAEELVQEGLEQGLKKGLDEIVVAESREAVPAKLD